MQNLFLSTIFLTSLLYLGGVLSQQQQLVEIFPSTNCANAANLTATTNTTIILGNATYLSYAVTGLWKISICNNTCQSLGQSPTHRPLRTCVNYNFTGNTRVELTRFGHSLQNQKEISFYSGINLEGSGTSFLGNASNINVSYRSFFSTGNFTWTVYQQDGTRRCVIPDATIVNRGYGFTLGGNSNTPVVVTSISEGCLTETTTTTTPRTNTTTRAPGAGTSLFVGKDNIIFKMCFSTMAFLMFVKVSVGV